MRAPAFVCPPAGGAAVCECYSTVAVFLLSAIALVVSSGYSVGAGLLTLGGLFLLAQPSRWPALAPADRRLLILMLVFFASWALALLVDGQPSRRLDKPLRILAAAAALLWLLRYPPRPEGFWGGVAVGGIGAGVWGGWQKLVLEAERAGGYTHMIQFGNLSMLLGMLSLAGLGWVMLERRGWHWGLLLSLGAALGILGSLFSGARGGWIGVPFLLLILYQAYGRQLPRRQVLAASAFVALAAALLYLLPATGVQQRVHEAVGEVVRYERDQEVATSVGFRLEMWRAGGLSALESPWFGLGEQGYADSRDRLIAEGRVAPGIAVFGHLHNDFLDTLVKRGLVGLLALLALYFLPLRWYAAMLRQPVRQRQPYAAAGAMLCVAYVDYGLTQTFLSHNSGVMMFFFMMVVIWSLASRAAPDRPGAGHGAGGRLSTDIAA